MRPKGSSYFRQTGILTSRYLKTYFNDKQNILLAILIPLLTILIVSGVAAKDMFAPKVTCDHSLNAGYPILAWQNAVQEKKDEFAVHSYGIATIDDEDSVYFILEQNVFTQLDDLTITLSEPGGDEIFSAQNKDVTLVDGVSDGYYSAYAALDEELTEGKEYTLTLSATAQTSKKNLGRLENEYTVFQPKELEDKTDDVTEATEDLRAVDVLDENFDLDDYYADNTQKLMSLPQTTMRIDGDDYVLIGDVETFVYIFSDKNEIDYGAPAVPPGAQAGDAQTEETEDSDDLNEAWLSYNYYLNVDVDLNGYDDLMPLGDKDHPYKGVFDGNGHIIRGLTYKDNSGACGLIGALSGSVKSLGVEEASIDVKGDSAGAIAAICTENAKIYNCYVTDSTVKTSGADAGSVVGTVISEEEFDDLVIYNVYARDVTLAAEEHLGGLVGYLDCGALKACYSVVTLEADEDDAYVGAIVGMMEEDAILENARYIQDSDSDFRAFGTEKKSKDDKAHGVVAESEDGLKEHSAMLGYVHADDTEYGFKRDGQLDVFNGTQTGLFMLACVAIFVGICNSIQEICKERNILKREYMTNLKLTSYVSSKLIVQAMVCAVQMLIVLIIFAVFVSGKQMYKTGVLFGSIWIEYFISMFLLCFASDTMALLISSIVKNSSTANTFIPIILIVQIVFSGVLFDLGKAMDNFAKIMVSKWGIGALAASSRLNDARLKFLLDSPAFELNLGSKMSSVNDFYTGTAGALLQKWGVLVLFIVVCSVLCTVLLRSVKKDKR